MRCKSCGSDKVCRFTAEMAIHLSDINRPPVLVFPQLFVCLNCGKGEFAVPDNELRLLAKREAAAAAK